MAFFFKANCFAQNPSAEIRGEFLGLRREIFQRETRITAMTFQITRSVVNGLTYKHSDAIEAPGRFQS
jgi:hypothetical protein